jgi:hypothetical protein
MLRVDIASHMWKIIRMTHKTPPFARPFLLSRKGLKVHVGPDGILWTWLPQGGQDVLAASDKSAQWLLDNVPSSENRRHAVILCEQYRTGSKQRLRFEAEMALQEKLHRKMSNKRNRRLATQSWDRRGKDSRATHRRVI